MTQPRQVEGKSRSIEDPRHSASGLVKPDSSVTALTSKPSPGDILRFKGLADVVVEAEAQKRCEMLLRKASEAFHVGMKAWIVSAHYLKIIRDEQIYLHLGYPDLKTFLEERFDGGRTTAFAYMQIAKAFPLSDADLESKSDNVGLVKINQSVVSLLSLPALYNLDWRKLSDLSRLPEEMRNSLLEKGKFTITFEDGAARIVPLAELQSMSREAVHLIVASALSGKREPRYRRGQSIAEVLPDLSPEAARILELIRRRSDMIIGLCSKFERLGEKEWTKVQRKRVADQLRGICDLLIHKAREIDPVKGRAAYGKKKEKK